MSFLNTAGSALGTSILQSSFVSFVPQRLMPIDYGRQLEQSRELLRYDASSEGLQSPAPIELKSAELPISKPYDKDLATQCREKLGYDGHRINSNHLAGILFELKIEPFDIPTVEKYKHFMKFKVAQEKAEKEGGRWMGEWVKKDIKNCTSAIPETVLSRALAIKDKLPDANFYVEELEVREQVLDPFLWVEFGKEKYCIAVWEEPTFEG